MPNLENKSFEKNRGFMNDLMSRWRRSLKAPPDIPLLCVLGIEMFRAGYYAEAGQCFNFVLSREPEQKEISQWLNRTLTQIPNTFDRPNKVGSFLCCDRLGNYIATGGSGKDPIILWDFWSQLPLKIFPNPGGFVRTMSFSPCGLYILVGGNDQTVRLGEFHGTSEFLDLGAHDDFVIALGHHGEDLLSAGQDGKILYFKKNSDRYEAPTLLLQNPLFYSMLVRSNLLYLAGYGIDRYDFKATEKGVQAIPETKQALFFCMDVSRNQWIAAGEGDASNATHLRYIWLFHEEKIYRFPAHQAMIKSVQFHEKYPYLLSSSFDGTTKLFEWPSGKELGVYPALVTGMSRFHPYADYFIHFGVHGNLEIHPIPK